MSEPDARPYQVFLSHSSHDRAWADAACAALEDKGLRCRIAPRDITPGTEWGAAIIDGIDRCAVMVLIFSNQANESAQVRREVERAIGKGVAILPLRVEDVPPRGAMEYALSNTHWLDAFTPPAEERLRHLTTSVAALLRTTSCSHEAPSAVQSLGPAPRKSSLRLVAVAAGLVAVVALAVGIVLSTQGGDGNPTAPTTDSTQATTTAPTNNTPPVTSVDETPKFQGPWMTITESYPQKGPLPPEVVAKLQHRWRIQGENLIAAQSPLQKAKGVTYRGEVTFRHVGTERHFDFKGADDAGNRIAWTGIYVFENGVLAVCYRVADESNTVRPTSFPRCNQRPEPGAYFFRLRQEDREGKLPKGPK